MAIILAVIVMLSVLAVIAFARLLTQPGSAVPDRSWLDEFSIEKYRPMLRLLSERDYEFLALQSGFTPEMGRKLRTERRRIFRAYLAQLVKDFNRLLTAAREAISQGRQDRSDLAFALVRCQAQFYTGILLTYGRLGLHTAGLGTIDVRGLVQSLESLRIQIAQPAEVGSFA